MASVNYLFKSKKNLANLYCRFTHTRQIDLWSNINICFNPEYWNQKEQKIRNVIAVKNRDAINKKLTQLKIHVLDDFNLAYMSGEIIDKAWLTDSVNDYFNRPKTEVKAFNKPHTIYYSDFGEWWLDTKAQKWLVGENKFMTESDINKYKALLKFVKDYEHKSKLKFKSINDDVVAGFIKFMVDLGYSSKTIQRQIGRFKFFCLRAKEENINIDNSYAKRVFIPKPEEIKEAYLDPKEIEKIFNHDFSKSDKLDNVRDNLIIAVWTGLRISDFMQGLNIDNFIDDFIEITNQKTGAKVSIPIHPNIKHILLKRNGQLPRKVSDSKFNKSVKLVCKEVGLNTTMKGSVYCKEKKRKVTDFYPKYKLVSSHIGRRSMATNHFGKIANQTLMKICGWSSEKMMLHYIKKSDRSYAIELQKYWETVY